MRRDQTNLSYSKNSQKTFYNDMYQIVFCCHNEAGCHYFPCAQRNVFKLVSYVYIYVCMPVCVHVPAISGSLDDKYSYFLVRVRINRVALGAKAERNHLF